MDDVAAEQELRELRARAYGPRADIAEDPEAMRRLQELESARRAPSPTEGGNRAASTRSRRARRESVDAAGTEVFAALSSAPPAVDDGRDGDAGDTAERLPVSETPREEALSEVHPARWKAVVARHAKPLWAASVVIAGVLAAVVAVALTSSSPVSASSGAPQVDVLELTATDRIPEGWFGADDGTVAAEYLGFTIFSYPGWNETPDDDTECVAAVITAQIPPTDDFDQYDWSYGGDFYSGCSVGAFPATVEVPVDRGAPDELTGRYPAARALQFVLDGDRVGVFVDSGSD